MASAPAFRQQARDFARILFPRPVLRASPVCMAGCTKHRAAGRNPTVSTMARAPRARLWCILIVFRLTQVSDVRFAFGCAVRGRRKNGRAVTQNSQKEYRVCAMSIMIAGTWLRSLTVCLPRCGCTCFETYQELPRRRRNSDESIEADDENEPPRCPSSSEFGARMRC